jgi:hypothetical protein
MYERRGWVCCPGVEQQVYGVTEVRYRRELPRLLGVDPQS